METHTSPTKKQRTLYEDRFGIKEMFVKVDTRDEECRITGRIGQESELVLLVLEMGRWVGDALGDVEQLLFGYV